MSDDAADLAKDRAEVARQVAELIAASGLSMTDLAQRLGTSRTRLSTYRSGRVVPSAVFMVRLRRIADATADVRSAT